MYEVISSFVDLQDGNHKYSVGDVYPRKGCTPSQIRIAELSGAKNKLGKILIREQEEAENIPEVQPDIVGDVGKKKTKGKGKKKNI